MVEINFSGPYALLPNSDDVPFLLASEQAWGPGLYLWTFLYNQAHRVNFVGVCTHSIAERHNNHLADFLAGRRAFYQAADLASGKLSLAYRPEDGSARFVSEIPALMNELTELRVFFAPFGGPEPLLERIGTSLVAHFQRLGGRAADWLDNDPVSYDAKAYDEPLTLRLGRPAFIASLPDEMHL